MVKKVRITYFRLTNDAKIAEQSLETYTSPAGI